MAAVNVEYDDIVSSPAVVGFCSRLSVFSAATKRFVLIPSLKVFFSRMPMHRRKQQIKTFISELKLWNSLEAY